MIDLIHCRLQFSTRNLMWSFGAEIIRKSIKLLFRQVAGVDERGGYAKFVRQGSRE
jgi:hypothetical protein